MRTAALASAAQQRTWDLIVMKVALAKLTAASSSRSEDRISLFFWKQPFAHDCARRVTPSPPLCSELESPLLGEKWNF